MNRDTETGWNYNMESCPLDKKSTTWYKSPSNLLYNRIREFRGIVEEIL